ncbi:MAG: T9SS type A sorting domain-containing protein [Bacteroidia bacterium]
MKKNLFLFICICFAKNLFAQFDTTTAIYDFNSLAAGNLNGQDNWVTTKWSTNIDIQVADTGYDGTKSVYFNQVGPNVGCDANKELNTTVFPGFSFTPDGTYILSFDIKRNYWGLDFGIAADLNNDGIVTKTDANEKALIFTSGSFYGEKILLPNGTVLNYNFTNNNWVTYEITLSQITTVAGGRIGIRARQLGTSTWTVLASNLNAGIDTTVASKANPLLWNMMYMHHEGGTGYLDNIQIIKITPDSATGIFSQNIENSISIYPNPASNKLTVSGLQLTVGDEIKICDIIGKEIYKTAIAQRTVNYKLQTGTFPQGIYFVQIKSNNKIITKKISIVH